MSSRNRPRGNIAKEDFTDELNLWNSVLDRIKSCQAINAKYEAAAAKIPQAEQDVSEDDPTAALAALDVLSTLHRECLKCSESELKILNDEPEDLIKNIETLISVRTAMEAETPAPRERHHGASGAIVGSAGLGSKLGRNGKRKIDAVVSEMKEDSPPPTLPQPPSVPIVHMPKSASPTQAVQPALPAKKASRSGSIGAASVTKTEPTSDAENGKGTRGTSTAATTPTSTSESKEPLTQQSAMKFAVGNEVFYRIRSKDKSDEGEGIICTITDIIGEGKHRRYEIQDTEPDDNGHVPPPTRAAIGALVMIPISNLGLPSLSKGRSVFARYPGTNTFYKAEVVGKTTAGKKDVCRLKFEGEEDAGTEKEVERRYVLDSK